MAAISTLYHFYSKTWIERGNKGVQGLFSAAFLACVMMYVVFIVGEASSRNCIVSWGEEKKKKIRYQIDEYRRFYSALKVRGTKVCLGNTCR